MEFRPALGTQEATITRTSRRANGPIPLFLRAATALLGPFLFVTKASSLPARRRSDPQRARGRGGSRRLDLTIPGDVFAVDTTFRVDGFCLRNIQIEKFDQYKERGDGVHITGRRYLQGLRLEGVDVRQCHDALYILPEDAEHHSMADLLIRDCSFVANANLGIEIEGHVAIGRILDNNISNNVAGGILMGGKGLEIAGNNLEGQYNPLRIADSASEDVYIHNNYFEDNMSEGTRALIELGTTHGVQG